MKKLCEEEKRVRMIFDSIVPRYDLMNVLITLGRDQAWRRYAVKRSGIKPGGHALDLCCGTGRLTRELARCAAPGGLVVGLDLSPAMLEAAYKKSEHFVCRGIINFKHGSAMDLPFEDSTFDCVITSWGLRNLPELQGAVREMVRVVKPGGRVVSLDTGRPGHPLAKTCYSFYLKHLVPFLGRLCTGNPGAYSYLYASVQEFPLPEELAALFYRAGLTDTWFKSFGFGALAVVEGTKPVGGTGVQFPLLPR